MCKIPSLRVSIFEPNNCTITTPTVTWPTQTKASVDFSETCRNIPTDPRRFSQREHKLLKPWQPWLAAFGTNPALKLGPWRYLTHTLAIARARVAHAWVAFGMRRACKAFGSQGLHQPGEIAGCKCARSALFATHACTHAVLTEGSDTG